MGPYGLRGGRHPRKEWEDLLGEMRRRADHAGWLRLALPAEYGGRDATNLEMAIIREHLATKGLGLHNDLQQESLIVGNFPTVLMMRDFGTAEQKAEWMPVPRRHQAPRLRLDRAEPRQRRHLHGDDGGAGRRRVGPQRGQAVQLRSPPCDTRHRLRPQLRRPGLPSGITAFLVPTDAPGFTVEYYWWTFNMPTDHAEVTISNVRVPSAAVFGEVGRGLELAQHFVHENRIRQAASSLGAAQFCINEAVAYANERVTWGRPLSVNQGIQFPLVELHTEAAMLRQLVRSTAGCSINVTTWR